MGFYSTNAFLYEDPTEAIVAIFIVVVAVVVLTLRYRDQQNRKQIGDIQRRFAQDVEERARQGENFVPSIDQSMGTVTPPSPPPPPTPKEMHQETERRTASTGVAGMTRAQMRQAVIWSEILGSRGGKSRR